MKKCAATALSSKLVAHQKEFFANMVVDAVMMLDELLPLNMIGVKKIQGGALEVSMRDKVFFASQCFYYADCVDSGKHKLWFGVCPSVCPAAAFAAMQPAYIYSFIIIILI